MSSTAPTPPSGWPRSPSAAGGPGLLLASYGGVLADRYERVTVLIVSSLVSAVLMTGMAVVVATAPRLGWCSR